MTVRPVRWMMLFLLLLLGGYLLSGVNQIRPGERAVVRRFGRVLDEKPEPGLWLGLPWGMDQVDRIPVDLVRPVTVGYRLAEDDGGLATPPGQLLTGDHNLINVQVVLNYRIRSEEVEQYVVQADRADDLVARAAETVMAEWVAGRTVDDVLINGKTTLPPWLVRRTQERLEAYRLGVQIQDASVAHLLPPSEVKDAFDEVNRAQTEIRTRIYQAEQEAERLRRGAESEKFSLEQQTIAYIREQSLMAHAEADTFENRLRQYQRLRRENPNILSGIWWDEMGRLLGQMKQNGRIDLLDNHLGRDGLDITVFPPLPRKR